MAISGHVTSCRAAAIQPTRFPGRYAWRRQQPSPTRSSQDFSPTPFTAGSLVIEHPAGTISVEVIGGGRADGISAVLRSTARKLFDGTVFADLDKMAA